MLIFNIFLILFRGCKKKKYLMYCIIWVYVFVFWKRLLLRGKKRLFWNNCIYIVWLYDLFMFKIFSVYMYNILIILIINGYKKWNF